MFGKGKGAKPAKQEAAEPAPPAPAPIAAPAPATPAGPDPQVEAQLRRLGEQVQKLQASLEGARSEGKEAASKMGAVEENLRSLMALSEALSNAFNPLAATYAEGPGGPAPRPEALPALAPPAPLPASPPPRAGPVDFTRVAGPAAEATRVVHPVAPASWAPALPEAAPPPEAPAVLAALAPAPQAPVPTAREALRATLTAEDHAHLDLPPATDAWAVAPARRRPAPQGLGAFLPDLPPQADATLAALAWLDHLNEAAGTDGARRLLAYYEAIGWLGPEAHARLLALGTGLPVRPPPERAPPALEVHAATYASLERLRSGRTQEALRKLPQALLLRKDADGA